MAVSLEVSLVEPQDGSQKSRQIVVNVNTSGRAPHNMKTANVRQK
jgi:hypothetical protein